MDQAIDNIFLNDYCVRDILRKLDLRQLALAACVSKQFQTVAQLLFSVKFRKLKLNDHITHVNKATLDRIFTLFGERIEELYIDTKYYNFPTPYFDTNLQKRVFGLIREYCGKPHSKLNSLTLMNFPHTHATLYDLFHIFKSLKKLILFNTRIPCLIGEILNALENAEEISIADCNFTLYSDKKSETMENTKLKSLSLKCSHFMQPLEILSKIDTLYPKLEHLKFEIINRNKIDKYDNRYRCKFS